MSSKQKREDNGRESVLIKTTIRVPAPLMERIDRLIEKEEIPLSKNVWILQALKEKADREEKGK